MSARDRLLAWLTDEDKISLTPGACDCCGRLRWLTGARGLCAACHVMTARTDAEMAVRLAAADMQCRLTRR